MRKLQVFSTNNEFHLFSYYFSFVSLILFFRSVVQCVCYPVVIKYTMVSELVISKNCVYIYSSEWTVRLTFGVYILCLFSAFVFGFLSLIVSEFSVYIVCFRLNKVFYTVYVCFRFVWFSEDTWTRITIKLYIVIYTILKLDCQNIS